jgi:LacI family transcriptional regulator
VGIDHSVTGYREVAERLRNRIRTGALAVGNLLPTEREMVDDFKVSRTTVRRALADLVRTGWAESIPNRGVSAKFGRSVGKRQVIGFVDHATIFTPHLFLSLNAHLQPYGYVLTPVDSEAGGTEAALEYCAENRFAAAVVWSKTINPDRARVGRVLETLPVVAVDHALRGLETDLVECNVFEGAKTAVRHLASLGRRNIAVMGMLDSLDTTQERFAGYLEGLFEVGLCPHPRDFLFTRTSGAGPYLEALERRLSEPDAPDALFVMQDQCVVDELIQVAAKIGVSIPDDVAVVAMGSDEPVAGLSHIGLSTVAFDWAGMAEVLCNRVLARIANPASRPATDFIPANLMVRGSCGAPRETWTEQAPLTISSTLRPRASAGGLSPDSQENPLLNRMYRPQGGTLQQSSLSSTLR